MSNGWSDTEPLVSTCWFKDLPPIPCSRLRREPWEAENCTNARRSRCERNMRPRLPYQGEPNSVEPRGFCLCIWVVACQQHRETGSHDEGPKLKAPIQLTAASREAVSTVCRGSSARLRVCFQLQRCPMRNRQVSIELRPIRPDPRPAVARSVAANKNNNHFPWTLASRPRTRREPGSIRSDDGYQRCKVKLQPTAPGSC